MMRYGIWIALWLLQMGSPAWAQTETFFVQPEDTDTAYSAGTDSHFVAIQRDDPTRDRLLLYMGGTNSSPSRTTLFLERAAELGYHAASISYPNSTSVQSACGSSADRDCHMEFRQEACFGTPMSGSIDIDSLNSIVTRTVKLLQYLARQFPGQSWDKYVEDDRLVWSKVVTAGHSQGAGHALYLAQARSVARCLMFSGANDYSNFYDAPAQWVSDSFATPRHDMFSFLHLRDEGVPDSYDQFAILDALGLWAVSDSVRVDGATPPYQNAQILYTNEQPRIQFLAPFHNATVVDNWTPINQQGQPVFSPVWTYMLTTRTPTAAPPKTKSSEAFSIYPNPATDHLLVEVAYARSMRVYDLRGHVRYHKILAPGKHRIDISSLEPGLYIMRIQGQEQTFLKK